MTSPFDRLAASIDYPMVVVTAAASDGAGEPERSGCLVGFTTQCSISPPRWLVCISKLNHTHDVARRAGMLIVHFPTPDDCDLARLFGAETGDEVDKFAHCSWTTGPDGATPVLDGIGRWFAGRIVDRLDLGDHTGFVLDVVDATFSPGDQLGFQAVKHMPPGHPPDEV